MGGEGGKEGGNERKISTSGQASGKNEEVSGLKGRPRKGKIKKQKST